MRKRSPAALVLAALAIAILPISGCWNAQRDDLQLSGMKFAIVVKSEDNSYFKRIIEGFSAVVQSQGGTPVVREPSRATAEEQIRIINNLISDKVDVIAIATNSESAVAPALQKAIEQGIQVISFDSAAEPPSRAMHVNQADAQVIAKALMDAAADITGGNGQVAIMSTTNQANNQNTWIGGMRGLLEAGVYPGLMLVNIVYGEDDYDITYQKTQHLIDTYPDLALVIAPTAAGIPAVAQCIVNNGLEDRIKVIGLGMPSQMAQYIGNNRVCPYMFLWDLDELGKLTAYAAIALANGTVSGQVGEILPAGEMGEYHITGDLFGGSEIALQAEPIRFDQSNIEYWRNIY
ncbi:MAG: substrate-binding domain-containing protein [Clostridiales bacterium]|jgi:rhamnose transport system substrate-binding protein|nr:substrate-binding domain-containing protein [Clostridiales bacterium]